MNKRPFSLVHILATAAAICSVCQRTDKVEVAVVQEPEKFLLPFAGWQALDQGAMCPECAVLYDRKGVIKRKTLDGEGNEYLESVLAIRPTGGAGYVTWIRNKQDGGCSWGHYFGADKYDTAYDDFIARAAG